ncbi:conserved protein, unknown function [Plasmodium knowlesi strain H]|uniref:FPL domain-containing protein n=2 Tax=Plasmodium knowlesi TaxID=5850 RepID=A0A679KZ85_PLAKH|nr:conserved protein, unknown function [Plasmodium knowlesi strain H]OTN64506.1 Uncharacterized protein PKNOH_S130197900 [Plasmodium knowlesi]CAA9989139.1 conserved protein, unknown function [Plasmodium knowlesi strain H]VVS78613.1 conserved protein, unknown function [Plasmodium knowlesi strain H]
MWNVFNFNNFDDKLKNNKNEKEVYTHEDLRYYFEKLVKINLNNVNINNFIELLRKITQITIWGDKYDDQIFQYFCEDNIFNHFIYLLRQNINKSIRIQIYQSLTLLIQNLQKDISLYYIFSNNKINNLIYTTFIYQDDEIMPYYISMIKSISFFLNYHTSKFFFNEKSMKFPLYTESLRLYKFNDIITRTYVKNIILNILKIEDEGIENLILLRSAFFTILVCYLRNHIIRMNKIYTKIKESEKLKKIFNTYLEEVDDVLYFFEDMLNCQKKRINDMLIVKLLIYFFFPMIGSFHSSIYFDCVGGYGEGGIYEEGADSIRRNDPENDRAYGDNSQRRDIEGGDKREEALFLQEGQVTNSSTNPANCGSIDYVYFSNQKKDEEKASSVEGEEIGRDVPADSEVNGEVATDDHSKIEMEEGVVVAEEDRSGENKPCDAEEVEQGEKVNQSDPPQEVIENIKGNNHVPFIKIFDRNLSNVKNFHFCKSLSSSNASSVNSNLSNVEMEKAVKVEPQSQGGSEPQKETPIEAEGSILAEGPTQEKSISSAKKSGKKGDNTYEFLYFRGRKSSNKEKAAENNPPQGVKEGKEVESEEHAQGEVQKDGLKRDEQFINENELKDSYFRKRKKKKIFIQMTSTNGVLHKKRRGKSVNGNGSGVCPGVEDELGEAQQLMEGGVFWEQVQKHNLTHLCHLEIPTLQKKITFDDNVSSDLYNYLFNFNNFTTKVLKHYQNKMSITNVYYNIFKLSLLLHPLCYVNSFKNFSILYNYLINTTLSLFILIRSLNILKNDRLNQIVYSLIFGEYINVHFLHRILCNDLNDPYFYNYFFDTNKKMNISENPTDDVEFENVYCSSIDYLLPEYNKEEEMVTLDLVKGYYIGEGTTSQEGSIGCIPGGQGEDNTHAVKAPSPTATTTTATVVTPEVMRKYDELSNPILLNFLLLMNVQKEKNIKKCEKDNMKNKISDVYLLLSIQFASNFVKSYNGKMSDIGIPFFQISHHNFVYVFWSIINVHINNLYLRIITLKLLINLTMIYIEMIEDKRVCVDFAAPLLGLIQKIKKKLAQKIKSIIGKMEYKVCQIFWEESKIYENCFQEKINICRDSVLINIVNDVDESGDNNFLCYPVSQIEIYRRNVHVLFALDGVSKKLQKLLSFKRSEQEHTIPFDFNYNDMSALIDIKNKNTIKCYLKNSNKIFNCYYIEDNTNFLLCIPSNSHVNQALIIFSYPLMLIDLYIDKNDNKKLIIHIYGYNNEDPSNVEDFSTGNFNNSEKIFHNNNLESNYMNTVRCYSSNNEDGLLEESPKVHKNDYILNKYSSAYKKNRTITNMKKEWCHKELNFMKNILKLNFYDTTRSLIVYKEVKSGIQHINDKYKKKLEEYLNTF